MTDLAQYPRGLVTFVFTALISLVELPGHSERLSAICEALAGSAFSTCVTSTQSSAESW